MTISPESRQSFARFVEAAISKGGAWRKERCNRCSQPAVRMDRPACESGVRFPIHKPRARISVAARERELVAIQRRSTFPAVAVDASHCIAFDV